MVFKKLYWRLGQKRIPIMYLKLFGMLFQSTPSFLFLLFRAGKCRKMIIGLVDWPGKKINTNNISILEQPLCTKKQVENKEVYRAG